jgi:hypothetical protein
VGEDSISIGCRALYSEQDVKNFNALQFSHSERYVFSAVNDFRLVKGTCCEAIHISTNARVCKPHRRRRCALSGRFFRVRGMPLCGCDGRPLAGIATA